MSDPHRAADEAWLRHLAEDKFDGDTDQALWSVVRAARLVDETRTDLAAEGDTRYRRRRGGTTT